MRAMDSYAVVQRERDALIVERDRWHNIAESRLGDERKYLGKYRRTLVSASRVTRHKAEIRRLTRERDALKEALGWDASLAIIRALTPQEDSE